MFSNFIKKILVTILLLTISSVTVQLNRVSYTVGVFIKYI